MPGKQSGQVPLMYLFLLLPMPLKCLPVFNVGQMVSEKMKVQNAADNAAYSAAVWEARYMNLTAYTTRAMIANYDTMATIDALWSMMDSLDGFMFLLLKVLDIFFGLGEDLQFIHSAAALANQGTATLVGSNGSGRIGALRPIEMYSSFLSLSEVALYIATQFGRSQVIKSIAWSTDSNIQYSTFAEILNTLSLNNRIKYDKTDKDDGLRLSTERSMNNFSNGGSIRDGLENLLPSPFGSLLSGLSVDLLFCEIGIRVGPKGFNGPPFNHKTGATSGEPKQDDDTVIIQNDKIYEHDFFGLTVKLCFSIDFGHHSDDAFNSGLALPHIVDLEHTTGQTPKHVDNFDDNKVSCSSTGGALSGELFGANSPFANLTKAVGLCNQISNLNNDDDPNNDQAEVVNVEGEGARTCDQVKDEVENALDEVKNKAQDALGNPCATQYEWHDKLEDVKVTTYVGDDSVLDGRRIEGPTVFVYFRKKKEVLPLFSGFGLTNKNDIEAYSMGKVYYTQRLHDRTDDPCSKSNRAECNRETMFNPFWAARLEKPSVLGGILLH